jgi:uncharacterized protein YegL
MTPNDKIKATLKAEYTKANSTRKTALATKYGFADNASFEKYLGIVKAAPKKKTVAKKPAGTNKLVSKKQVVHNVFVMDASSSMGGPKYRSGIQGIKTLIESIAKDDLVDNTLTVLEFSTGSRKYHYYLDKKFNDNFIPKGAGGCTPLYRTLGEIIAKLLKDKAKNDKVLLNITTDGGDTDGWGEYSNLPQTLKDIQENHNFTVTFVGTQEDVNSIVARLNVDKTNTLVHDNTGKGMEKAFATTNMARTAYSLSASKGEEVTLGFYKSIQ